MKIAAGLVVMLIASLVLVVGASVFEKQQQEKEERKFINVQTIDKFRDDLVLGKITTTLKAANETAADDEPCYPVPYGFCVGCAFGCSDTCFYYGSYDSCVKYCMSWHGWAPNTKVTVTYFPYGQYSNGGCICNGQKCA